MWHESDRPCNSQYSHGKKSWKIVCHSDKSDDNKDLGLALPRYASLYIACKVSNKENGETDWMGRDGYENFALLVKAKHHFFFASEGRQTRQSNKGIAPVELALKAAQGCNKEATDIG